MGKNKEGNMRKTLLAAIILLLACLLFGPKVFCQSYYDTSLYKQIVISNIEPAMYDGGRGYVFTVVSGEESRFAYIRRATKVDWNNYKNGECLLLSISQWNDLLKNKKQ
jgi:hypothetical protein